MNIYSVGIGLRHDGIMTAGEDVWAMRFVATSSKIAKIRKLVAGIGFDGTPAASSSIYAIYRFGTATHTGGTAPEVFSKYSGQVATDMTDVRYDSTGTTGLSNTGVVVDTPIAAAIGHPRQNSFEVFEFDDLMVLRPGDGMLIRLSVNAVVGDVIRGYVEWEEVEQGA